MDFGSNRRIWIAFLLLLLPLMIVLVIGLGLQWKYRFVPAMKARQKYAQIIMMIVCFTVGVGSGVCALLYNKQEDGARFHSYSWLVLGLSFGHYASMDVYFYRVWLFYYKCKLQNEFEKVWKNPANLCKRSFLSHMVHRTSSSSTKYEISIENEQKEHLIRQSKPESVRKSKFVRYRHILGHSMLNKAFWFILWVSECIVVFCCFRSRRVNKNVRWSPSELTDEFCTSIAQILCLIVLFVGKADDLFRIKMELRLIFFISTVEILLFYTFLYVMGTPEAYLSMAIGEFWTMVAITCANCQAVRQGLCISAPFLKLRRSFQEIDSSCEIEWTIMDILNSESRFQAFERHLKREFSLENLNFIVAVVHYRRLCEELTHNSNSSVGMLYCGKNTCRAMKDISMQPFGLPGNLMSVETSYDSFNLTPLTPTCGPLLRGLDPELGNSSPLLRPPEKIIDKRMSRRTPRLSWIESEMELCGDKENIALFIFDEYCDRGAPQEINLSRRVRHELIEFFSHSIKDPDKLKSIFDRAFDSVLDLLENDSLKRFRRNFSFSNIIKD